MRERGEDSWPRPDSPLPLRVEHAELHGAWGLKLTWNDGHDTGIFPFELLRRWHEGQGEVEWSAEPRRAAGERLPARAHNQPMKAMVGWTVDVPMEHLADPVPQQATVIASPLGYDSGSVLPVVPSGRPTGARRGVDRDHQLPASSRAARSPIRTRMRSSARVITSTAGRSASVGSAAG